MVCGIVDLESPGISRFPGCCRGTVRGVPLPQCEPNVPGAMRFNNTSSSFVNVLSPVSAGHIPRPFVFVLADFCDAR
jgi:hypothetical protein